MKPKFWILPLCLLLLACQPTPDEPFIIQNDQKQMLITATRTDVPDAVAVEQKPDEALATVDLYEQLGAPKTMQTHLSGTDGRLQVDVNAKVLLPAVELPIARVESRRFSREDVDVFIDALIPPEMAFVDFHAENWQPKGMYIHLIERADWAIEHWDEGGKQLYDMDDSTPRDVEKKKQDLLLQQAEAPATSPKLDRANIDPGYIVATADDQHFLYLMMNTSPWDGSTMQVEYLRDSTINPNVSSHQNVPNDILQQTAEAEANALLAKLQLDGFALHSAYPDAYDDDYFRKIPCWRLYYTREINGAPETVTDSDCTINEYNHQRDFELLQITVDQDGVAGLRYKAPQSVTDILAERTNLLPFEKIEEIFNRMILVYKNHLNDGTRDQSHETYHITSIRLGLVNIPEENAETGLLVPAWDFLGYRSVKSPYEDGDYGTNGLTCFLTINAVDGSIINREGCL